MTTATAVPQTRAELEGDDALETLRRTGRRRLLMDSIARFRGADGFTHSRALAFQLTLTILPALIAIVGLATVLDQETFRRGVQDTINALAPGAAGDIETALIAGFVAAVASGTAAMAQVEQAANRIYGVERDRPFLRKLVNAIVLALSAGLLGLLSVVVLVGGTAIRNALGWSEGLDTAWAIARWPLGLIFAIASVALLFEYSPRRRQPEASWLAFGALVAAGLWLVFMGLLSLYLNATDQFGATYGPLAGTIGLLLWSFLTSSALLLGLSTAAQLEAVRAGIGEPRIREP